MFKLVILLAHLHSSSVGPGEKLLFGPDETGRYASPGEGFIETRSCTVTADGMAARFDGRFITFYDREGREEAQCEAGRRPVVTVKRETIRRQVAVVTR